MIAWNIAYLNAEEDKVLAWWLLSDYKADIKLSC